METLFVAGSSISGDPFEYFPDLGGLAHPLVGTLTGGDAFQSLDEPFDVKGWNSEQMCNVF